MKPIDFIVIGAGRSGTTWVWTLLRQHPKCFVPAEKELHYFNREALDPRAIINPNFTRDIGWYERFFKEAAPSQICGEISPGYLWSETAAERIWQYNPRIKLVALLRDPVERSYSQHLYRIQRGNDPAISFAEAIRRHPFILERSLYGKHLGRYFEVFPSSQIKVLFHESLRMRPREFANELEEYLGIDYFFPDMRGRVNPSGSPTHPRFARLVSSITMALQRHPRLLALAGVLSRGPLYRLVQRKRREMKPFEVKPRMDPQFEQELRDYFRVDIDRLEDLLGTDLGHWKSSARAVS